MDDDINVKSGSFTIAIIGGGLCGLALAVGLLKHKNVTVHIYEAASEFSEIGAGVAFGPNSVRALGLIDPRLLEGYKKHATYNSDPERENTFVTLRLGKVWKGSDGGGEMEMKKIGDLIYHLDDNHHHHHTSKARCWETGTKTRSCIHRARLLDELVALIPPDIVTFNKALVSIEELSDKDCVLIRFADGTTATASAVVGCDGIKSKTRDAVFGHTYYPNFVGEYAYRALIPKNMVQEAVGEESTGNGQLYCGEGGYIVSYPVENGQFINLVAAVRKPASVWADALWQIPALKEEMYEDLKGWYPPLLDLISCNPNLQKWALFDLMHNEKYYKGRLCLAGDSAHATSPHLGAGAGMAMEDAYILSNLIGATNSSSDLEKAFAAYDAVRRPRTQTLIRYSRLCGLTYSFEEEGVGNDIDLLKTRLEERYRWLWYEDLEDELASAKALMI